MTIAHQNGHFNREKNDGSTMDQPWINHGSTMDQPWILMIFGDSHLSIASPRSCADVLPDLAAGVDFTANASGAEIHRFYIGFQGKSTGKKHGFSHEKKGDS